MRLVSSLAFVTLALATLGVPAAFAVPNTGTGALPAPKAPVAIPLAPKPTASPTPSAAPTSPATPLPSVLTMEIRAKVNGSFVSQPPLVTPLLDFRLSSSKAPGAKDAVSVLVPLGSTATKLEQYYPSNTVLSVKVFVPPNTLNAFNEATIASFNENASSSQGSAQFALTYSTMTTEIVSGPNPLSRQLNKAPLLMPGHAP